jgi:predicted secreted hydrolase
MLFGRIRHFTSILCAALLLVAACFAAAATAEESIEGYALVTGPCGLTFPKDHGAHPGFRTEWWYYTGNVETTDGRPFGYQLTIFRRQISPPSARERWPEPTSPWRTQQIYFGHLAVSDITAKTYRFNEAMARGALGMAGVHESGDEIGVSLKKWRVSLRPEGHQLTAGAGDMSIALSLIPRKDPVLHGDRGYSVKGDTPERASCYYSYTHLETAGTFTLAGRNFSVKGLSWMDHEFSTAPLQPGVVGWDWFSLQMDNDTELMIFLLREGAGRLNRASSGTFVGAAGIRRHLTADDFQVKVVRHWQSPHSQAVYPAGWQLRAVYPAIELEIAPNLADQELRTTAGTGVTYWEGSVSVRGTFAGKAIKGKGYVELTGYAGRFEGEL